MEDNQIQVKFVTKLPEALRVPPTPFAVPARLTRYGLSEVINTILSSEEPVPFDFIVENELLRTSLENFLRQKSISTESVLTVEYLKVVVPPSHIDSKVLNDWVTAVTGISEDGFFLGGYDGTVRLFSEGNVPSFTFSGHTDAVTDLALLKITTIERATDFVISSSRDLSIRVWQVPTDTKGDNSEVNLKESQILKGHKGTVEAVAFCSGSWDTNIKVWKLGHVSEDKGENEDDLRKKRKTDGDEEGLNFSAALTLSGHSQSVSSALWTSKSTVVSGSWDHSIRSWDVSHGVNTLILNGNRPVLSISQRSGEESLLAEGGADSLLKLWDTRNPSSVTPVKVLVSHKNWISAVKWSPVNPHQLASASYDKTVKLWDIRSEVPVQTFQEHTDKVFCLDFWKSHIVSGGADSKCHVYNFD